MTGTATLKDIKQRLDRAKSKADYDALSTHLDRLIHDVEISHDPRLGEKERKEQAKREAQTLVARMQARVDALKEEKKAGKYETGDSLVFRKGLERAETDLSMAQEALARLT